MLIKIPINKYPWGKVIDCLLNTGVAWMYTALAFILSALSMSSQWHFEWLEH